MKNKIIAPVLGLAVVLGGLGIAVPNINQDIVTQEQHSCAKVVADDDYNVEKPVIYIYDKENAGTSYTYNKEKETTVRLSLSDGKLGTTYPKIDSTDPVDNVWKVTAYADGKLVDEKGNKYDYLFWDAQMKDVSKLDVEKGFSVRGEETAQFLEEKLPLLGLNESETNDFITYWLPKMEKNAWNTICFQNSSYTNWASLNVTPAPDQMIRVFMAWYPTEEKENLKEQDLERITRKPDAVVEWGGIEVRVEFVTSGSTTTTTTTTRQSGGSSTTTTTGGSSTTTTTTTDGSSNKNTSKNSDTAPN